MMDAASFNLMVSNLIVGLFHGDRRLVPASRTITTLGYCLAYLEPSFKDQNGRLNPDGIAYSDAAELTILAEWSTGTFREGKKIQLLDYAKASPTALTMKLGIPSRPAQNIGVWVILAPGKAVDYQNDKKLRALPNLLWEEFHIAPNQFELVHVGGEFPDPHLTKLLKDGVRGKRLPQNYVKVSLDNLTIKSLAEPVMQSLISFATKEFSPFSAQQLASDTYGVFDKLAFETRLVFIRHVKEVMNQFLKNHGKELVRRSVPDPPTWEFTWDGIDFGRMHVGKKLQRAADNFLKSINHGLFQASLFDE